MYEKNNIFAKMINGDIPCNKAYEDDFVMAFHDINPAAPIHILIIPKTQHSSFDDFTKNSEPEQIAIFFQTVQKIAKKLGVIESGYRLITNHGTDASQTVQHFHIHLLAGKPLGGLLPDDNSTR